jgi:hypothetical protein
MLTRVQKTTDSWDDKYSRCQIIIEKNMSGTSLGFSFQPFILSICMATYPCQPDKTVSPTISLVLNYPEYVYIATAQNRSNHYNCRVCGVAWYASVVCGIRCCIDEFTLGVW